MCEPMSIMSMLALASTVGSAYVGIQSANAQAAAVENETRFNEELNRQRAELADREKVNVRDRASLDRRRLGEKFHEISGDAIARFAAMGVDPNMGTPGDLIGDSKRAYDIDRSIISGNEQTELYALDLEKHGYAVEGQLGRQRAAAARTGAALEGIGYALDGVSNVASIWTQRGGRSGGQRIRMTSTGQKKPLRVGL